MKQKILDMIEELKGDYDQEDAHGRYDDLLEDFIFNYDKKLLPLMKKLITLEKHFWYA